MNGPGMWLDVATAGGLGAVARFLVDLGVSQFAAGRSRSTTAAIDDGTSQRGVSPAKSATVAANGRASPRSPSRPWLGTMVVNVTGSFLAGVAAGSAMAGYLGVEVEIVVAGGFLGAYTTFSTAMFQAVAEFEQRRPVGAITNLAATLVLAVGAAWLGVAITT